MDVRRVVTGHDAGGKAVFVSDEHVAPVVPDLLPGNEFHRLWGGDVTPHFPDDGTRQDDRAYFPPVGGFRFGFFTIPPDGGAGAPPDVDIAAALADLEGKLPGLAGHMEPDNPGMHTTATIDFEVVLSGCVEASRRGRDGPGRGGGDGGNGYPPPVDQPWQGPAVAAVLLVGPTTTAWGGDPNPQQPERLVVVVFLGGRHPPGHPRWRAPRVQQVPRRLLA